MQEKEVQLIKISEMSPQLQSKALAERKPLNTSTIGTPVPNDVVVIEEKAIDLVSVSSEELQDDDTVSFDEGRLQQWNGSEFRMQLAGTLSGIILLFGCASLSAWAIADFLKDIEANGEDWISVDYEWNLLDKDEDEFFQSRHVILAMLVMSWNVGYIIGGALGAFIVPLLPNRSVYTVASVCMMFNAYTMTQHTSIFYCAKIRIVLGLVYGLVHVAVIIQAAESTTKKVRRWILVIVAYTTSFGNLLSILMFYYFDDRVDIWEARDIPAIRILCYVVGGCGTIALIVNFVTTTDTVPFHLNRGDETKAFKEISRLKMDHLSMLDIRYEYERIRFETIQEQLEVNRNLASRVNYGPLSTMCCIRILNLLFNSVPMTLLLIWDPATSQTHTTTEMPDADYGTHTVQTENENHVNPLLTLAILQGFRLLCSVVVMLRQDKYHINRFCYKLAFVCGFTLVVWFFVRTLFAEVAAVVDILVWPVSILFMTAFTGLPIPLDVIQLCQTADSYARIKNTWALAGAILVENLFHMLLIAQMDLLFGIIFVYFLNGVAMMYFSWWLLQRMPNVVAIAPITIAVVSRYPFKRADHMHTVHM